MLLVSALCALTASGEALAHGDPSTHYLETGSLYPIKVSLVASADDLVDAPEMLASPQRYAAATASRVVRRLARAAGRPLRAHVAPLAVPVPAVRSTSKPADASPAGGAAGWAPFAALALGLMLAAVVQRRSR